MAQQFPITCDDRFAARTARTMVPAMSEIRNLLQEFTERLTAFIDAQTRARVEATIMAAVGTPPARRRGRPPKMAVAQPPVALAPGKKTRRKMPRQLCPVPGCTNTAAPIFGMVCSDHQDVPKRLIKKYREARKAKKLAAAGKPLKTQKTKVVRAQPVSRPKKVQTKPVATAKQRRPRAPKTVASSVVASSPTAPLPPATTSSR
jgi:hypothetical protein